MQTTVNKSNMLFCDYYKQWISVYKEGAIRPVTMNKYNKLGNLFSQLYKEEYIKIDEPLKNYVNFKVGGPADILLIPETKSQVIESVKICRENNIPVYVIGNGSNLLVKDGGIRGVVILLTSLTGIKVVGEKIEVEAGVMLKAVSDKAMEHSLTGFEFACGIPGTIGGAVFMNAGAYDGCMSDVVESVEVISEDGEIKTLSKEELEELPAKVQSIVASKLPQ